MEFLYSLDTSSKKYICPSCEKKTFVRYVNNITKEFAPENFGKCDRKQNCDYTNYPKGEKIYFEVDFLKLKEISEKSNLITFKNYQKHFIPVSVVKMLDIEQKKIQLPEWLILKNNIPYNSSLPIIDDKIIHHKVSKPEPKQISYIPETIFNKVVESDVVCNLVEYLFKCLQKNHFTSEDLRQTILDYSLCGITYKNVSKASVFWQNDLKGKIRYGKVMQYNPDTGKRLKRNGYAIINSIAKLYEIENFNREQCFYGLHLIKNDTQNKPIGIVESEKTAIVLSLYNKSLIWLASGSLNGLTEYKMKPIKSRKIILYPDKGCFEDWKAKAKEYNSKGYQINVSDLVENESRLKKGDDLEDLVRILNT